jgi:hypothetical protein
MDSTLARYHNDSQNNNLDDGQTESEIFRIQVNLAAIIAILLGSRGSDHNPLFITQFNQDRAW